jgi:hypothetical protein
MKEILDTWNSYLNENLILEMNQRLRNKISSEIKTAESGRSRELPFNDIFGMPTEQDPKLRMILPYGNKDINILKRSLSKIIEKIKFDLQKEQTKWDLDKSGNIMMYETPRVKVSMDTIQQKQKPLGWQQGDPIPTVDKQVASLNIFWVSYPSKGNQESRENVLSFAKALQKYDPENFNWWQGEKGKEGKYNFFLNNTELLEEIAASVNSFRYSDDKISDKEQLIIFSRHPIDVLRMSDFKKTGIQSCHSPGKDYFKSCMAEVKDLAGGGILFVINKDDLDKVFPDGKIPQKGDIFNDNDANLTDLLNDPETRLRIRKVVDFENGVEYAVPDSRMYGNIKPTEFRKTAFSYFSEKQKDKFIDNEGKLVLPEPNYLSRYGGSYEDSSPHTVGENFMTLVNLVIKQNKIDIFDYSITYDELDSQLRYNSIAHEGKDEDDENDCEPLEQASHSVQREARSLKNLYFECDVECNNEPPYASLSAGFDVRIPISMFINQPKSDGGWNNLGYEFEKQIRKQDRLNDVVGHNFTYPDMNLEDISFESYTEYIEIRFSYSSIATEPREIQSNFDDIERFDKELSEEELKRAVLLTLQDLGWVQKTQYQERIEQITKFANWVDKHDNFDSDIEDDSAKFTYTKILFSESSRLLSDEQIEKLNATTTNTQSEQNFKKNYWDIFDNLFNIRASKYIHQLGKQYPMFKDMPLNYNPKIPELIQSTVFAPNIEINYVYGGSGKKEISITLKLDIEIKTAEENENIDYILKFIEELVNNNDIIDDIAYETLYKVLKISHVTENRKQKFKRLIKEWALKQ